jgi:hypothetical protein
MNYSTMMIMGPNEVCKGGVGPSATLPEPCLSYWQRTTRAFPHLNANRNTPVPTFKKYVIIGSGISGALSAFELTENGVRGEDVIILEAREAASGASSRNAGHVRPGKSLEVSRCHLALGLQH